MSDEPMSLRAEAVATIAERAGVHVDDARRVLAAFEPAHDSRCNEAFSAGSADYDGKLVRLSALEQVADAAREVVNDGTSRTALARLTATVEALDTQEAENA